MADQRFAKYGDKRIEVPADMTLDQLKKEMARVFPELADPDVKTDKKEGETTYTFAKKAGRKG